jgi:hypothetical protein
MSMARVSDIVISITANMERFRRGLEDARRAMVRLADTWHDTWLYSQPWYRQVWHFLWCKR